MAHMTCFDGICLLRTTTRGGIIGSTISIIIIYSAHITLQFTYQPTSSLVGVLWNPGSRQ